ncbi:DgyrCDS3846 [Dimorphilus gyrociliatus]|uniref:Acylglycerol kinase, mitochondrial n=1 Tax=Dimorphilus gyrociliatus TaxID=2664684 RepID=A0A7I8VEV8_9ANNE|nr:DgyrCDS3846 [Dimorphilus gyrociliatus]
MGIFSVLRNNWKKTVFFSAIAGGGIWWGDKKYRESLLRAVYCKEAQKYGAVSCNLGNPRRVIVFLNPAAQSGKARSIYEKNVAPLLHLAGLQVSLIRTEYEGQGKQYAKVIEADEVDAIVIAGGNGTVGEIVTGLFRSSKSNIPVGVIPLGKTNTVANKIFGDSGEVLNCLEAAMSIIKGVTKKENIMKIRAEEGEPVFALSDLLWGTFRDTHAQVDKYWYYGPLKRKVAYLATTLRGTWPPTIQADITYTLPCSGCNKCVPKFEPPKWRWWHILLKPQYELPAVDYSKIVNENCGIEHNESISGIELHAKLNESSIAVSILNDAPEKMEFIKEGWAREKNQNLNLIKRKSIDVQSLKLNPQMPKETETKAWLNIDNEEFELFPLTFELIKSKLLLFSSKSDIDHTQVKSPLQLLKDKCLAYAPKIN